MSDTVKQAARVEVAIESGAERPEGGGPEAVKPVAAPYLPRLLNFEDVTVEGLKDIFEAAAIGARIDDDGEVYANHGLEFPIWVLLDDEQKTITLRTYLSCREDAPVDELASYAQRLNDRFHTVQFSGKTYDDDDARLMGSYTIHGRFGILVPQLLLTMRRFSSIFIAAVRETDVDNKFFE